MTQPAVEQPPAGQPPENLSAWELLLGATVFAMLTAWLAQVANVVLAPFFLFGISPDPSAIWGLRDEWQKSVDKLMDDLAKIAEIGWKNVAPDLPYSRNDPMLQDLLELTRNLLVRIPDELYMRMVSELSTAVQRGETLRQQAARIDNLLSVTGSENWPWRAKNIAVTEVNRAYSMGSLAAGQRMQARMPGRIVKKRWNDRDDAAVRPAHARADGQTVPVNEPFHVGGESLMMPLDPRGKPWNVIGCRCRIKIEVSVS